MVWIVARARAGRDARRARPARQGRRGEGEGGDAEADELRRLLETCAHARVIGGAVYDAMVAAAAVKAKARLLTLDACARPTYAAMGAHHELVT
jgi:hypothetical protein